MRNRRKKAFFFAGFMQDFKKSGFRLVRFMSKNGPGKAANAKNFRELL